MWEDVKEEGSRRVAFSLGRLPGEGNLGERQGFEEGLPHERYKSKPPPNKKEGLVHIYFAKV